MVSKLYGTTVVMLFLLSPFLMSDEMTMDVKAIMQDIEVIAGVVYLIIVMVESHATLRSQE
jgi:hypothetical protein